MSDDNKGDNTRNARSVFELIEWAGTLTEPMSLAEVHDLREAIEAGTAPPLSDREKQLFATLGLIVGHSAHDFAKRQFERDAPSLIAALMAKMGGPGDEGEGGGTPGSVQ